VRAFLAVARNEITQILRDRVYLLLLTVGGVGTLVTLAYTLSADIENVRTLVVDRDASQHSHEFVQALANDRFFDLEMMAERDKAEEYLQDGTARVVVVIPDDYGRRIERGDVARVQVLIDGSEPGVAVLAESRVLAIAGSISQQLAVERLARQGSVTVDVMGFRPRVEYHGRVRYNADLKTVIGVVPGLMGIVLTVPAVGASAAFARERERGSFEVVASTPLGRWPLLLGRVFPYVLVGLLDIGIFVVIARAAFGVPLRGGLGLFVVLGCIYIFATASSGVFVAQFLRSQHGAAIITFELFGIAPVYLSDIFFPVASMPVWLKWLSASLPATHFTAIARGVLLKGVGWDVLWPNALALSAMGAAMSGLAYVRFRKRLG
jgi:ABC-2 type transport system permease protein